jgi:ABC-2 type transport system ATP-binding protein
VPTWPGLVHAWQIGNRLELVVVRFDDEHRRRIEALNPLAWEPAELNLEDAFIEYTRGPRRSLPIFVRNRAADVFTEVGGSGAGANPGGIP